MLFRAGKTLSKKNAKKVAAAHALLSDLLTDADPEDVQEYIGGPTGTQNMPQPDGQGVMDATGSRAARPLTRAQATTIRTTIGNMEVR